MCKWHISSVNKHNYAIYISLNIPVFNIYNNFIIIKINKNAILNQAICGLNEYALHTTTTKIARVALMYFFNHLKQLSPHCSCKWKELILAGEHYIQCHVDQFNPVGMILQNVWIFRGIYMRISFKISYTQSIVVR